MTEHEDKEQVEEVVEAEAIHVDEDAAPEGSQAEGGRWTEEIKVAGEELLGTVKKLIHEANVRRVIIHNSEGKTVIEIPLVFGVAGIALLPTLAAVGLVGALITDCSITVVRAEKSPEPEVAEPEEA